MNKKGDKQRNVNTVGNFTKNAVENFEENIVTQKDFLEKAKAIEVPYLNDKYH